MDYYGLLYQNLPLAQVESPNQAKTCQNGSSGFVKAMENCSKCPESQGIFVHFMSYDVIPIDMLQNNTQFINTSEQDEVETNLGPLFGVHQLKELRPGSR